MIRWLQALLSRRRLQAAKAERLRAWEAHRSAILRGDTRRQHETRQALTRATTVKLRLEVGR